MTSDSSDSSGTFVLFLKRRLHLPLLLPLHYFLHPDYCYHCPILLHLILFP